MIPLFSLGYHRWKFFWAANTGGRKEKISVNAIDLPSSWGLEQYRLKLPQLSDGIARQNKELEHDSVRGAKVWVAPRAIAYAH